MAVNNRAAQLRTHQVKLVAEPCHLVRAVLISSDDFIDRVYDNSRIVLGENVYKIGMTRRDNPQERIDELGDASVPFNFDVHAMIFSDDAPALEAALHRAFEDRKLNMVNRRREFFNVSLDEIKQVVKNHFDKTVEFIDVPDAEQYRISQKLRANRTY